MSKQRLYISLIVLLLSGVLVAAPRYKSSTVTHWLGVSLNGVEANYLPNGEHISIRGGGGGGGQLLYELKAGGFFLNIGVGADYILTNTAISTYTDAFSRLDRMGEMHTYRYNYSRFAEQQRQVRLYIPLQVGYQFGDWVYVGVGASLRTLPLLNAIESSTLMYTQGEYERFIEPFRNAPYYGFWSEAEYSSKGVMNSATNEMAVEAEIGVNIPLNAKKLRMRVGLFAGYDIPLSSYDKRTETPLVDYSAVNTSAFTQSQQDLHDNIRFNSMFDTPIAVKEAQRLRVGLKLTLLFDITPKSKHCMCWK
ncbi:MAG: hypothetical protein IJQ97_07700 [Paludibacteraceae bacterium]|nr:hypothetical protein [Paludibacteraceae bacterium]